MVENFSLHSSKVFIVRKTQNISEILKFAIFAIFLVNLHNSFTILERVSNVE